ncbi:MAG TPA: tetratricopeptide repeat protein [Candidatus Eisenbacteria bacterium]|nr:tetratricopeptide repeat protein [Candidatus Eisenbacteria bacterium]
MKALVAPALAVCLGVLAPDPAQGHAGIDTFERASADEVAKRPKDPAAHLDRAKVHQIAGEWDAALAEVEAAADLGTDPDVVGHVRGEILLDAGWPRTAKVEFDRVLARTPAAFGTLFDRGRAWLALGNAEEAAKDFGRVVAGVAEPRPEQVIAQRDALVSLGRREDAVAALDAGIARIGHVPSLELAAVDLEVGLRRFESALRRLDGLLAKTPSNPAWIARRGEILADAGRGDDARREYAKALALIDARPAGRGPKPFDDLRRQIETALAQRQTR